MQMQSVVIDLPEDVYNRFKEQADQTNLSVEAAILEAVIKAVPEPAGKLMPELERLIEQLPILDDATLKTFACSLLYRKISTRTEDLHYKRQDTGLSEEEEKELVKSMENLSYWFILKNKSLEVLMERGYSFTVKAKAGTYKFSKTKKQKMTQYTENEQNYLRETQQIIKDLRLHLAKAEPDIKTEPEIWLEYLSQIREIQGNIANRSSFIATLLVKSFLEEKFGEQFATFDAATKKQGANGLDIDVQLLDGTRVIGEIKTTGPGKQRAEQLKNWRKDIQKLQKEQADYKYFFVINKDSYDAAQKKFAKELRESNIEVIQLPYKGQKNGKS